MPRLLLAVAVLLATIAPALLVTPTYACTCTVADGAQAVAMADVVVVGTVEAVIAPENGRTVSSADPFLFTISSERYLKGTGGPLLQASTVRDSVSCGIGESLEAGEQRIVFLHADDGGYSTSSCSGGRVLTNRLGSTNGESLTYLSEVKAVTGEGTLPDPSVKAHVEGESAVAWNVAVPSVLGGLAIAVAGVLAARRRRSG